MTPKLIQRILLLATLVAMLLLLGLTMGPKPVNQSNLASVVTQPTLAVRETEPRPTGFQGSASCSSVNCHGEPWRASFPRQTDSPWNAGAEYTMWHTVDPHAAAYRTLQSPLSQAIVAHLTGAAFDSPEYASAMGQHCFGCHAPAAPETYEADSPLMQEGVGCESCHGQAERWLLSHFGHDFDPLADGMRPTQELRPRAETCVGCHVGTGEPGKEVNHDLIAAGHPRLNFEFRAYHDALPKHWLATNNDRDAIQAWIQGQFVSAEASLFQLRQRALRKDIWPEFAEMDCYSCHRGLRFEMPGEVTSSVSGSLGSLRLQRWYLAGPRAIEQVVGFGALTESTQRPIQDLTAADPATANRAAEDVMLKLKHISAHPALLLDSHTSLIHELDQAPYQAADWESHAAAWLVAAAIHAQGRHELARLSGDDGKQQQAKHLQDDIHALQALLGDYRQRLEPPAEFVPTEEFVALIEAARKLDAAIAQLNKAP